MAPLPFTWAACIPRGAASALGAVRLIPGLDALAVADAVWVRGPQLAGADANAVRRVPWEAHYELLEGGQLRRAGRLLPERQLPDGAWVRLPDLLCAEMRTPSPAGRTPAGIAVELRPDCHPREPSLLEARTADWTAWVNTAPALRLERLVFACDLAHPGHVLVRGTPLPPLAGLRFVEEEGIAVSAGARWWPEVSPATLRTALRVEKSELALLHADGRWLRVPRSAWIAATRPAVRRLFTEASHAG